MKNSKYWCPKCHKYQGMDIIYEDDLLKEAVITKRQGKQKWGCLDWSDLMTYECCKCHHKW